MRKQKQLPFQYNLLKLTFSVFAILFTYLTFGTNLKVSASDSGIQKMKQGKIYTNYDVTGDKIKDSVKMTIKKNHNNKYDYSETLRIYVNNSVVLKKTAGDVMSWEVNLISIKSGMTLFDITNMVFSDDVDIHKLFQYKNGKLKSIYDLQRNTSLGYTNNHYIHVKKVSGNTIHCNVTTQFLTTGGFLNFNLNLRYKDGKFKIPPISYTIKYTKANKWTVNKQLKIYKEANSKELAYVLRKGDIIKINGVIYKGKRIYFQIKNKNGKGQVGYLPATKDINEPYCFKETYYSG